MGDSTAGNVFFFIVYSGPEIRLNKACLSYVGSRILILAVTGSRTMFVEVGLYKILLLSFHVSSIATE